jgi:GMP synthase-like glutamine amidotransferase
MKITILETGRPPEVLRAAYPSYPTMFETLLAGADPTLRFESIAVVDGAALPDPATLEAVLITGSPAGVYDPEPWIAPLEDFIRDAATAGTPQVGICFGHQIMAQAFGGKVEKSTKGWGVGRHRYRITARPAWMAPEAETFAVAASHQDQVVALAPTARVLAESDHCAFAALDYSHAPAMSLQGHPEMTAAFAADLVQARRGSRIPEPIAAAALASLTEPTDHALAALWITRFLRAHRQLTKP